MSTLLLFFKSLPRLFKNSKRDMSRHLPMVLSSMFSIAISLTLAMVMIVLSLNVVRFANNVEQDLQIEVALSPALLPEDRELLKEQIAGLDNVAEVTFSSKEAELQTLIEEYGETFAQYEQSNPLYDVFFILLEDPSALSELNGHLETYDGIVEISSGGDSVLKLVEVFDSIGILAWAIIFGLALLGIFLIRNTISLMIALRRDEIFIMRRVGAYDFYVSTPFILQGLSIGFRGALIPCVVCSLAYLWIYAGFNGQFVSQTFSLYPPVPFMLFISLGILSAGLVLGTFGSWLAVRRYLKEAR